MVSRAASAAPGDERANGLGVGLLGIAMPYQFGAFRWRAAQGIPDGCRGPGEYDPRDADWMTDALAPLVNLGFVGGGHRPESFKPRAQLLQFAALVKAANEGLPVNGDDGLSAGERSRWPAD